eukprot:426063-Pyramimonas_sp.AAC.1
MRLFFIWEQQLLSRRVPADRDGSRLPTAPFGSEGIRSAGPPQSRPPTAPAGARAPPLEATP